MRHKEHTEEEWRGGCEREDGCLCINPTSWEVYTFRNQLRKLTVTLVNVRKLKHIQKMFFP